MPVFNNVLAGAAGSGGSDDYQITRSLRFDSADNAYLSAGTDQSAGDSGKFTISCWLKKTKLGSYPRLFGTYASNYIGWNIGFDNNDRLDIHYSSTGSNYPIRRVTTPVYRDPSAWLHIVVAVDLSINGDNCLRVYVNGTEVTNFDTKSNDASITATNVNSIARRIGYNYSYSDQILADFYYIDGQQLDPTSFGKTNDDNGRWDPIAYTGTYGPTTATNYSDNGQITLDAGNYHLDALDGPYGFDNNNSTFIECRKGSAGNNTTNIIFQPTGGISNVTNIKVDTLYATHYRINDGSWTSLSSGLQTIYDSTTAITLNKLEVRRDTAEGSDWGHRVISYHINNERLNNDVVGGLGFHLDFSDDSSNSAVAKDSSGNGLSLTGVDLDNDSDYLDIASSTDFAYGTGDFTWEMFVYRRTNGSGYVLDHGTNGGSIASTLSGARLGYYNASTGTNGDLYNTGFGNVLENRWTHLAVVRQNGVTTLYRDGYKTASQADTHNYGSQPLTIGQHGGGGNNYWGGLISNFRIVKGTAVYTSSFQRPTAPLTNITNTVLLCCQDSSSVTTATVSPGAITKGGNASVVTKNDNDWTTSGIQAVSFDAVGNSSHVGPGTLTNLAPGTYYNVFAVDSNNVSSDPGDDAIVRFNFSALGLTAPATITFDSYEQGGGGWTSVSSNVYTNVGTVTSSSTATNNTRHNTVNIPSGATYFELPGSYNSSHSLYSNGIHNLTWNGVPYQHVGFEGNDSLIDSPTDYEADSGNNGGNYCTWNPLTMLRGTMSNGNLLFYGNGTNTPRVNGTISASSGKWYYESHVLKPGPGTGSGDVHNSIGWGLDTVVQIDSAPNTGAMNHSFYFMDSGWYKNFSGSNTNSNNGKWAPGDVIGVAADLDNNTLTFYRNGAQVLSQTIGVTAGTRLCPAHQSNTGNYGRLATNFGQRPFKYPPGGTGGPAATFKALCTQNLDDPLIPNPSTAFDAKTYDGTSAAKTISLGFSPDLVWTKQRDGTQWNYLIDKVRGNTKAIFSNEQNGDYTTNNQVLTAFNSDGYSLGSDSAVNSSSNDYVSWSWGGGNLITNSNYNQSAVWSSATLSNATNLIGLFDGDDSTRCEQSTNGTAASITNFGPVSVNTTVSFYSPDGGARYTLNGGDEVSVSGTGWHNVNFAGTLTSFTFQAPGNARIFIYGMKIDGKDLVDAGIVPVGSQPNSAYNQSQKWTDFWSSTNGFEQNSQTFAFDLNDSNVSASASYGDTQSLVLSTGVPYSQSVRAMTHYTSGTAYINGNSSNAVNVASGWITLATGSGTLNRVDFTSNNARAYVSKIEVDGKLLVDPTPSVASTVRVNPTAKFSIVKYTAPGAGFFNVAHGLNATPGLIISKHTNRSSDWYVWHSAFTDDGDYISLNTTGAKSSATDFWSAAKPNTIAFGGKVDTSHLSGDTDIAYCWAPVEGYSAFGSYEGTGTASGAFNYTGFTPKFILIKNIDNGSNRHWILIDSARNTFNQVDAEAVLFPDSNQIESRPDDGFGQFGTKDAVDILSNGFRLKEPNTSGVWTQVNNTSQTYIWAAFASNPFKYARAF